MQHQTTLADLADRSYGGTPKETQLPNPWEPTPRVPAVREMLALIAALDDEMHAQIAEHRSGPDYYGIPRHRWEQPL